MSKSFKKAKINVEFNEALKREDLISGESINTLFGKIKKFLSDLHDSAFTGNAEKVNNHKVESDVPSNAKFTDTVYTHPISSGNKHIPSGGASGQVLKWSADGTAEWGTANVTALSMTLDPNEWSEYVQTINVPGVTALNNIIISPSIASQQSYMTAGIICTDQGDNTLTFSCDEVPTEPLTINIFIL